MRRVTARVPSGVGRPEVAPGDRLGGDRHRVEDEGEEGPDGQRQLHRGQLVVALPGRGVGHHQQRAAQQQRPHDQRHAGPGGTRDAGAVRAQRRAGSPGRAHDDPHERDGRAELRQQGAQGRAGDAEPASEPTP